MPITWPFESMSGPPELPGLIAASVWIMLCSVSVLSEISLVAVTVRPSAETMPWVTVGRARREPEGVADRHDGVADDELVREPKVTAGRFDSPWICSSAMSSVAL